LSSSPTGEVRCRWTPKWQWLNEYGINPEPYLDNVYYDSDNPKSGQFGDSDL
jgi:hypothetical protein